MSTKAAVTTLVALLLALGAGAYFMLRGGEQTPLTPNISTNGQNGEDGNGGEDTPAPIQNSMIRVTSPLPNASVKSPLTITGEARGGWYFEASFPVKILDANGKVLGQHYAQAQGEWTTNEFVPFRSTLVFSAPTTPTGTLVLEKDNPSGLPQNADEIRVPIRFASTSTSKTPIQDAIRSLLSEWDLPGVTLEAASLNNGVLTLTFKDPQHATSGGSARVLDMRAQIESVAKQFAGVNSVRIMPSTVFQP